MPLFIISTSFPVVTSIPYPIFVGVFIKTIPALSKIVLKGAKIAVFSIFSPVLSGFIELAAFNSAIPPPETIPSCNAALTA